MMRCTTVSTFIEHPMRPRVRNVTEHAPSIVLAVDCGSADDITLHFESPDDLRAWLTAATASLDELHPVVPESGACPDDPDGLHHVGCGCDQEDVFA